MTFLDYLKCTIEDDYLNKVIKSDDGLNFVVTNITVEEGIDPALEIKLSGDGCSVWVRILGDMPEVVI